MKPTWSHAVVLSAVLIAGFFLGRGCPREEHPHAEHERLEQSDGQAEFWTCSMHPQIRQPGPGSCPLCGMDLIPVLRESGADDLGPRELKLSPRAEARANVETVRVERRFVTHRIRLVGKVEFDETRLATITARVPGRLDRLYVDYTGIEVKQGDHMVYLYSPDLLAAQEEVIQALDMVRNLEPSTGSPTYQRAEATLRASREKLMLWGLTENQIAEIEQQGRPDDHITIYSPIHGVVIRKNALEGEYVQTGSPIYTVADLSRVWVKLDAYESDLIWLHFGQDVTFNTEAYPGESFRGKIAFIDPILNPATRTVKVRVNVENPDGRLKPEMFVRAEVESRVARGGRVLVPELAGKWISPMHPEIVKDAPGVCDVCGMPLVSAESLGYVPNEPKEAPLVIPATAPLMTGERAIVYVRDPVRPGVFQGREIVLGPRAGKVYLVEEGLNEGELVVHRGNFKIDSAMQILAKPSMMVGPADGTGSEGNALPEQDSLDPAPPARYTSPPAFQRQLGAAFQTYFAIAKAMAANEPEVVKAAVNGLLAALEQADPSPLSDDAQAAWMKFMQQARESGPGVSGADIESARNHFARLSNVLIEVAKSFGTGGDQPLYVHHCPMALDDQGADWIQESDQTHNPYFSGGMLRCGSVGEVLSGR